MVNRVTGLSGSGLDTEALVKQMMAVSQNRYDNIMKKKTETEWKKQLYNDIYAQMKDFDDQLFKASLSSFSAPKTATSTNELIATVTASSSASSASHTLKVISLASSASMTSSDKLGSNADKSSIAAQLSGLNFDATGTAKIKLNGKNIEIKDSMTMSDVVSKINEAGKEFGIKATYDSNTDRLFINSSGMGEATNFTLEAADGDANGVKLMNALKLGDGSGVAKTAGSNSAGKDSVIELDGTTFKQNSNDFTIAGLTFSLKAESSDTIMIGVKSDNSKLVENVKGLIQAYNNLLELINGKTSEKYYRDYGALTDEQRKEMSEKEIELWEEKAKSGILRNDSTLTGFTSKMRTAMYSSYNVDGKFTTMSSIGISTKNYQDKGKLNFDEEKFMKALEEDPDAVAKLFRGDGGLIGNLRGEIKKTMSKMEQKSGAGISYDTQSSWAKEIKRYTDQMDTMTAKMLTEENRYYNQFTALEKTLSQMNSNSSYLTSMFGS